MDYKQQSIALHKQYKGKLNICSKVPIDNKFDLSVAYSPGVAGPCLEIQAHPEQAKELLSAKSTVAVITDGTAVLGLGDIGPEAGLPVMEGKCALFKRFGNVDAFPIAINSKDTEEIIQTIKLIAPSFGGINLEDIAAPRCFEIEERLKKELDIPIFHDDQHGTAIVTLAGLINAIKVTEKSTDAKVVINGAGAAGIAIAKLLHLYGFDNMILCDSKGIISKHREDLNEAKKEALTFSNEYHMQGSVHDALKGADIFVGVSKGNLLKVEDIQSMNRNPIIMAMANPDPEITPDEAKKGGAAIVATGRSDYPNQINNVLVFPGIFKGAFESNAKEISDEMKLAAAKGLASLVQNPSADKIIPDPFDAGIAEAIAKAVKDAVK
ncbi:NADP-dependent malic enzyme [Candidatus Woesearchaeota archaeon]|nr:NADP-dependent malic enzyme [Nanoarchaeota archaeon]MCB9370439.1 NADP-dependent malic enzyme [Candidatus Woesearchaeota archaeon]USN43517.1 MAG: NADP-dependent malic enzyme [Candidatus Woesearchaeota archaeon]